MAKLLQAKFIFTDDAVVTFAGPSVQVRVGDVLVDVDNARHHLKPCVTHCVRLIRHATTKPASGPNEKRQRREVKPGLKLHKDGGAD